jgi:hypothetical protein
VRKFAVVILLAAASLGAAASTAGSDQPAARISARGGISVRVPRGWHLVRRGLTNVVEPAQRLAVASFTVRLASHSCACGEPNVRDFPRTGAFLFVWEYRAPSSRAELLRLPPRPSRFRVTQENPHWFECAGPSWVTAFRDRGRVFQVEVYLGPAAGTKARLQMDALLDSLRVAAPEEPLASAAP